MSLIHLKLDCKKLLTVSDSLEPHPITEKVMALGVGSQIIKVILFIFNLLWLLFGLVLVIVGALIYTKTGILVEGIEDIDVPKFAIFLMVVGVVTIIISFCGCCGAIAESQCMTLTYSALLFIVILVEIAMAIVIFVKLKDSTVQEAINDHIEEFFKNTKNNQYIDELQSTAKCCGTDGYQFWERISKEVPKSCCTDGKSCQTDIQEYFDQGCTKPLIDFVIKHKNTLGFSALGFALVEFTAFVFSCILANNMSK